MNQQALDIARYLADCGVPIFLAKPSEDFPRGGSDGGGYWLPRRWQQTKPDSSVLDEYQPGMAVCAVMGHAVDALDLDPRNGGQIPADLRPVSYGTSETPSGGTHDLLAPLGIRSKDGILPGVDLKAGVEGTGVGFIYIAPTTRVGKDGTPRQYRWLSPPDLDQLTLVGKDESGQGLAQLVRESRAQAADGSLSYSGPAYDQLTESQQLQADQHLKVRLDMWRSILSEAADWPEGQRDGKGRGWEALVRDAAWVVASAAATPWLPLDDDLAQQVYLDLVPQVIANDPKCRGKWYEGLIEKASAQPIPQPPWADFDLEDISVVDAAGIPDRLDDSHMASWMASTGLKRSWCWARGMGWMQWDGKRWVSKGEESAREVVRRAVIEINYRAAESGADSANMKKLATLLSLGRISSLTTLMRGVVDRDPAQFDSEPHLLNVGNGVVNLRTGALLPHDPSYLLTKITETPYIEGATHPDWDQALQALEPQVADWMQVRFGQGATGEPTSDDILPIGQGQGSNGKTTLITAIKTALGEHVAYVPEKVIRANPSDHPTELMSLHGVRIALLDETPEVAQLNVQRLKAVLGSEWMTARHVHRDNITWKATHSLFVMTNYVPIVRETDKGTWRRLALVKFDRTFPRDDDFRARVVRGEEGRREAVLAWVVQGARKWYDNNRVIPPAPAKVQADTAEWKSESNLADSYADDRLIFDPQSAVMFRDLADDFGQWLQGRRMSPWSDQLIATRLLQSEQFEVNRVHKAYTRDPNRHGLVLRYPDAPAPEGRVRIWKGLRWRTKEDDQ